MYICVAPWSRGEATKLPNYYFYVIRYTAYTLKYWADHLRDETCLLVVTLSRKNMICCSPGANADFHIKNIYSFVFHLNWINGSLDTIKQIGGHLIFPKFRRQRSKCNMATSISWNINGWTCLKILNVLIILCVRKMNLMLYQRFKV